MKNAFVNGDLKEDIYMSPPPGFRSSSHSGFVFKLKKSLYRLKQSPCAWYNLFGSAMIAYGFVRSTADHTLFLPHSANKTIALIV